MLVCCKLPMRSRSRPDVDHVQGGPTAAVIAYQNPHVQVSVVDRDVQKIRSWNSKHLPIYEPGLRDIVRIARDGARECRFSHHPIPSESSDTLSDVASSSSEGGSRFVDQSEGCKIIPERQPNLFFSTEVAEHIGKADIVLIAVNTPTKSKGIGAGSATDMTAFEAVTGVVAQYARPGTVIVEKSTVPCRTAQLVKDTVSQTWEAESLATNTKSVFYSPPRSSLRGSVKPRISRCRHSRE